MSTKHTPGPWSVVKHSWSDTSIVGARGRVCGLSIYCDATEDNQQELEAVAAADASLIAAAPDLLALAQRWAALDAGSWHAVRHENEKRELLEDTAAAIAKATGEQA